MFVVRAPKSVIHHSPSTGSHVLPPAVADVAMYTRPVGRINPRDPVDTEEVVSASSVRTGDPQKRYEPVSTNTQTAAQFFRDRVVGVDEPKSIDGLAKQVLGVVGVLAAGRAVQNRRLNGRPVQVAFDAKLHSVGLVPVSGREPLCRHVWSRPRIRQR